MAQFKKLIVNVAGKLPLGKEAFLKIADSIPLWCAAVWIPLDSEVGTWVAR